MSKQLMNITTAASPAVKATATAAKAANQSKCTTSVFALCTTSTRRTLFLSFHLHFSLSHPLSDSMTAATKRLPFCSSVQTRRRLSRQKAIDLVNDGEERKRKIMERSIKAAEAVKRAGAKESVIKKERKKDREGGKAKVAKRLVATTAVKLMLMKEGKDGHRVLLMLLLLLFFSARHTS